jgi:cytochrome c peroxidase
MRTIAYGLALFASSALSAPHHTLAERVVLAPGYAALTFQAPEPSTYQLEKLGKASDGKVLTSKGEASNLKALTGEKFTLLSFIYTSCSDINGCPLASHVLSKVQKRIQFDDSIRDSVRLISISFDRMNDSPERLEKYAASFRDPDFDWQFLTHTIG